MKWAYWATRTRNSLQMIALCFVPRGFHLNYEYVSMGWIYDNDQVKDYL